VHTQHALGKRMESLSARIDKERGLARAALAGRATSGRATAAMHLRRAMVRGFKKMKK
jgi:hypothetical protein